MEELRLGEVDTAGFGGDGMASFLFLRAGGGVPGCYDGQCIRLTMFRLDRDEVGVLAS